MTEVYDAESAVIGGLLQFFDECIMALEMLIPEDFESSYAAEVFQFISEANKNGKKIDAAIFGSSEVSKEAKEYALLAAQTFLTTANYDGYVDTVKCESGKRRIKKQLNDVLFSGTEYSQIISSLSKIVEYENENSRQSNSGEFLVDYVEQLYEPLDASSRIQTGFYRLDKALNGLRKGSLCYIGAFPSTGKTSFAINIVAKNLANKKRVLFFSLEMSKTQILDRMFSSKLQIEYDRIDKKQLSENEKGQIMNNTNEIYSGENLLISDDTYAIESMAGKISRFKPDLVIIDFLQNVRTSSKLQTKKSQVDYISSELKRLARVNNCAIITLSQLTRSNQKPTMSSLKESGNLEADGDYIMLMYRPYVTNKSGEYSPEQTEILLDKNKYGICGVIQMKFDGKYQKFSEIETRYEER